MQHFYFETKWKFNASYIQCVWNYKMECWTKTYTHTHKHFMVIDKRKFWDFSKRIRYARVAIKPIAKHNKNLLGIKFGCCTSHSNLSQNQPIFFSQCTAKFQHWHFFSFQTHHLISKLSQLPLSSELLLFDESVFKKMHKLIFLFYSSVFLQSFPFF